MKTSLNQIRVELKEIASSHLQINEFYWGDLQDAQSKAVVYPLMNCYYANNGTNLNNNTSTINIVLEFCDLLYKDDSNLNDVESDLVQICRDVYQTINKSPRWKKLGSVQAATATKFKHGTPDVIACVSLSVSFNLRDGSGVCDLPMEDYDFDLTLEELICAGCSGTSGVYSDGTGGYGADFFRIGNDKKNHFGHNFRFCGITGGYTDGTDFFDVNGVSTTKVLAFPETLVCDMSTVDCDGNFLMFQYSIDLAPLQTQSDSVITCESFTTPSFDSGFIMPTIKHLSQLVIESQNGYLEYQPFEALTLSNFWSSTPLQVSPSLYWAIITFQRTSFITGTTPAGLSFPVRITNTSELPNT